MIVKGRKSKETAVKNNSCHVVTMMKRAKDIILSEKDKRETEFEWDDAWYDIRPERDNTVPRVSIEQLREKSRKFWEEQERI